MIARVLIATFALAALAGCADREQTATGVKSDQPSFAGTGAPAPYALADWKQGDKASWEQQLRARTQRQNEYVRVNQQ
ncbi:hypothetical protein [Ramlibacter rhizophilus]|uniref:Lipoprotein n=1 Tax=Ramlibacter rhizophilus TaxID=1781167 RepID=A0A4Z0BQG4_9BURK|nr:hypothetical protein [Ramlibacter rhizophilus]TFZ01527.1 hypothetical protein EZ242_09160 [Ramlibacter rhizophilus]